MHAPDPDRRDRTAPGSGDGSGTDTSARTGTGPRPAGGPGPVGGGPEPARGAGPVGGGPEPAVPEPAVPETADGADRPPGRPDPGPDVGVCVAVVDDDTIIREGLPHLLPDLRVTLAVSSVEELLAARPRTDVVLLDLVLTGTGRTGVRQGAVAVEAVARAGYRVLIYTNERRREVLVGCMAAGAHGVIHKAEPLAALAAAVAEVADGRVVITQALVGLAELAERRGGLASLTPRQREVLSARARGETFRGIAERLFISKKTAEEHMAVVTAKFAGFLRDHSPADLERELGLGPGDLLDPRRPG